MSVSVRYIVNDVDAAIAFYTTHLGFTLDMHPAPPFAMLSRDDLRLLLSQPGAGGGGQAAPAGQDWHLCDRKQQRHVASGYRNSEVHIGWLR